MLLKVDRHTKNKIVTLELTTVNFTDKENDMLDQLGEPIIEMDKTYGSNPVKFSKKIRSGFRVKVKFDLSLEEEADVTADYITDFINELTEQLEAKMDELAEDYEPLLAPDTEYKEIRYYGSETKKNSTTYVNPNDLCPMPPHHHPCPQLPYNR